MTSGTPAYGTTWTVEAVRERRRVDARRRDGPRRPEGREVPRERFTFSSLRRDLHDRRARPRVEPGGRTAELFARHGLDLAPGASRSASGAPAKADRLRQLDGEAEAGLEARVPVGEDLRLHARELALADAVARDPRDLLVEGGQDRPLGDVAPVAEPREEERGPVVPGASLERVEAAREVGGDLASLDEAAVEARGAPVVEELAEEEERDRVGVGPLRHPPRHGDGGRPRERRLLHEEDRRRPPRLGEVGAGRQASPRESRRRAARPSRRPRRPPRLPPPRGPRCSGGRRRRRSSRRPRASPASRSWKSP